MARFADVFERGETVKFFNVLISAPLIAGAAISSAVFAAPPSISVPSTLETKEKQQYAQIYSYIKSAQWAEAEKAINAAPKGPMAYMARAELYLAPGSPVTSVEQLESLLNTAPYLPQAARLESLALKRGATNLPSLPGTQRFAYLGSAPKRDLPDDINDTMTANLRSKINIFIRNDDPVSAEQLVESNATNLPSAGLTELRYRVAWSYYIENDDNSANRVANIARSDQGEWGVQSQWVYALSSWRLKKYDQALAGFDHVGQYARNDGLRSAGLFWSSRAATAIRRPDLVQQRLQSAAKMPETFYGMIASEALGIEPLSVKQASKAGLNWANVKDTENVKIAVGLAEIGETDRADETLRFQSRIGASNHHGDLARLAGALNLPSTQLWMGHYGPSSTKEDTMARYPAPNWTPTGGWRVDQNLVFAHALQESQFRTRVISPAGARGLMQVRPGTAGDMARDRGLFFSASDLDSPSVNLEYGQSYMEKLRDLSTTGGLLPKVIAAYNAGPAPVARWNDEVRDNGDPLLFVESIPYWETRDYVSIILRNYWMYEMAKGKNSSSMNAMAQYLWPRFPNGSNSGKAVNSPVRINGDRVANR
jgi:soluble lytic murein transglycosylase